MTEPFDQDLFDRAMAEGSPELDGDLIIGFAHGAKVAARIAAERAAVIPKMVDVPMAWEVVRATKPENHHTDCSYRKGMLCDCALIEGLIHLSGLLAALGPALPVIPEWVEEVHVTLAGEGKGTGAHAVVWNRVESGTGPTWHDALTAAIQAAKEENT